jgi:cation diffusion facilitator CzcD-associated flavoprotein CzcO
MSAVDGGVIIVGAGFGGIGAAIELQKHGFEHITILDAASEPGGTWFYNGYPGAACDVPSHLYSYSYAQRRDWTRQCSPRDEILTYIQDIARRHGIDRRIVTGAKVTAARWDEETARWTVETADGRSFQGSAVVLATGQLNQPAVPRIPGAETFAGKAFHTARWEHDYDLRGKRVAVVGTGATAVQAVPEIAPLVRELHVFQRTGNWFLARNHKPYKQLYRRIIQHIPGVQAFRRRFIYHYGESLTLMIRHPETWGRIGALQSRMHMRWQLRGDPDLRRKVWPDYTFGCKRVLFSSDWLPALRRDNVDVVTDAVTAITPTGIVTADGRTREVDCIVWGTGFRTNDFMLPMDVTGVGGRTLKETWADGAHAHLGITVPGFPSMFLMYGPNTNTSGGSIVVYLEAQARYLRQALQLARRTGAAAVDVREDVESAFDRETQARFAGTAWTRCDSWYRNEGGRVVANWPGYMREYEQATAQLEPSEFELVHARERIVAQA